MSWRLAESLKKLREQINDAYPGRDKSSDGTIGDTRHKNSKSDHNPNAAGVVTAIDIDEDVDSRGSVIHIVNAICASRDRRVKYIIYEGRITVKGSNLQQWKPYKGVNPHKHHAHISVSSDPKLYDDDSPWSIGLPGEAVQPPIQSSSIDFGETKLGDRGPRVAKIQSVLGVTVDEIFGEATEIAVKAFQREIGLREDGIVGVNTWKALFGE